MSKEPKTLKRITWDNGRTSLIRKIGSKYHWSNEMGWSATSSNMVNVKAEVKVRGGTIDSVPNPDYDPNAKTKTSIPWLSF